MILRAAAVLLGLLWRAWWRPTGKDWRHDGWAAAGLGCIDPDGCDCGAVMSGDW